MHLCDACQNNDAVYHVSFTASIFGPKRQKTKRAQFWLCETCERASQQILCRDIFLSRRTAFRFVDNPSFMSPYKVKWRLPRKRSGENA
jgi:hypothetical protein